MDLRSSLCAFYYSSALCDLQLMHRQNANNAISYNTLLYLEIIYSLQGSCTASDLAELLHISKPGVSLKLREMLEQGLITKVPDPKDRRRSLLFVNEEAVPQYRVYKEQDDRAVRLISERFSQEDVEKFCAMLEILTEINYREAKGDSAP